MYATSIYWKMKTSSTALLCLSQKMSSAMYVGGCEPVHSSSIIHAFIPLSPPSPFRSIPIAFHSYIVSLSLSSKRYHRSNPRSPSFKSLFSAFRRLHCPPSLAPPLAQPLRDPLHAEPLPHDLLLFAHQSTAAPLLPTAVVRIPVGLPDRGPRVSCQGLAAHTVPACPVYP